MDPSSEARIKPGAHLGAPPLAGLRVIALEQAVAAPLCTPHLADLGADVIKVERPDGGDLARVRLGGPRRVRLLRLVELGQAQRRARPAQRGGDAPPSTASSRRPTSSCTTSARGRSTAWTSWAFMHRRWPRLISCGISGYGTEGPGAHRKGFDLLIQGESALVSVTGSPDEPAKVGISIADISSGMYALSSVLAALLLRSQTREGTRIDIAMLDCRAEWMMHPLYHRIYSGRAPARTGLRHNTICPYGAYPVAGGRTVNIGVHTPAQWHAFCVSVLDDPSLVDDPRFRTNELWVANRATLEPIIEARLASVETDALVQLLEASDIPWGVVNDVRGLAEHVQLRARDHWFEVGSPSGPIQALRPPFNLMGVPLVAGAVPALGEHTLAVLAEIDGAAAKPAS